MTLTATPNNPVPDGHTITYIKGKGGVELRCAHWRPKSKACKGTVTIVQGFAEYIEKYFEVVEELRQRGFYVVIFDLRGQGGSGRLLKDPMKGHVDSFDDFVEDLHIVLDEVSLPNFPGPHFILSHSTGGAITLLAHEQLRTKVDRIIMSSPLVEIAMPRPLLRASRILSSFLSLIGLKGSYVPGGAPSLQAPYEVNKLTSCPERFARMGEIMSERPKLGLSAPTIGWFQAAARSLPLFRTPLFGKALSIPSLVVAAGSDQIVSTAATEELCRKIPTVGYVEIKGAKHEILMEADHVRHQFWAAFDEFILG
ncbi:alpha/beta hydrolase [Flexibacterium corallicola]|uniref:alpha/beta hydrolase n=1 Tax=Flexibacterium corallicola TaxID=3037259 RepID=UPI00286FA091|nr:alpha/beta hydrolase [Pseudovibrio sp. M1P-2-3]